jgi:NAD(P)H-dependent flavin oxidoreductase YrpB (nitropropane dioxygenase family)
MRTRVTEVLGIEHPVLSAGIPVIGVDSVAAVSNAGGPGILGATYLSPLRSAHREAMAVRWQQVRAEGRMEETEIIADRDCGLIRDVLPAAEVVRRIVTEAEEILGKIGGRGAFRTTV